MSDLKIDMCKIPKNTYIINDKGKEVLRINSDGKVVMEKKRSIKQLIKKILISIRKPLVLKDKTGIPMVFDGENPEEWEDKLTNKLNRKVVILPNFLNKEDI